VARTRPRALGEAIRAIRESSEPATLLAAVQSHWGEAVGERIAAEAVPVRERAGTITVCCRAATWAQELDLLQGELLARLNDTLGKEQVERLRFIVGDELADDTL